MSSLTIPPPVPLTRLVGREQEIATLGRLLRDERLITLTGAGGSGKTRLAVEVTGRAAGAVADGVAWIELAPLREPSLVSAHVASLLALRDQAGQASTDALRMGLHEREMLLVLDNCEHVVDGCAELVAGLLRDCPRLRVLATSREALGVEGERAWHVPPLSVPDESSAAHAERAARAEAVQLFVERAHSALATFALTDQNARAVARICRRLDGLPLAIELAAARVRILTPEQIAQRLEDDFVLLSARTRGVPTRHQTLHAAVDWSYRLLSPAEQQLLARLSVFAGGFTLDAMESVCADGLAAEEMLELLAGLVDKSLAVMHEQNGKAHYSLLEVVRQFARHRLDADPGVAARVRRNHAAFFAAHAETALPHLQRLSLSAWMARFATEQDNFRAALSWSLGESGAADLALRLASALWWPWGQNGRRAEAIAWLDQALEHPDARAPSAARSHALTGAGVFAYMGGDVRGGRTRLEDAVAVSDQAGAGAFRGSVYALSSLALLLADQGEYDAAFARGEEAVRRARIVGEPWLLALAIIEGLGHVHHKRGNLAEAERAYTEVGTEAERGGYGWGIAEAGHRLALVALQRGDVREAGVHARRAAGGCRREGDPFPSFRALLVRAAVALSEGEPALAVRLWAAADALHEQSGAIMLPFEQARYEALLSEAREALGTDPYNRAWEDGRALSLQAALALAAVSPAPASTGAQVSVGPPHPEEGLVTPAAAASPSSAGLQVRALGPLQILRDGEPLAGGAWQSSRPRELLLYLLSHPKGRTREQIGLAFWPDATAAQVKNNFHVALHHLRKALGGAEWIVFESDRYRVNTDLGVAFDAETFGSEVRATLTALRHDPSAAVRDRLERALALYRGDFLEADVVGDWALDVRDRLRRVWVDGMLALAARLERDGEHRADAHREAADAYQRVAAREPLHEDAYRGLMRCLAQVGERHAAMRAYDRLATLLRTDFEAEPEPATTELNQRIRRAEPPR